MTHSIASPRNAIEAITDTATPRDKDGWWNIGNPRKGCQFCGSVSVKEGREGGSVRWYHPSTECCPEAITRQIQWRADELRAVQKARDEFMAGLAKLNEEFQSAYGVRKGELDAKLKSAQRAFDLRDSETWKPTVSGLGAEIARLRRKRESMRVGGNECR